MGPPAAVPHYNTRATGAFLNTKKVAVFYMQPHDPVPSKPAPCNLTAQMVPATGRIRRVSMLSAARPARGCRQSSRGGRHQGNFVRRIVLDR